MRFYGWRDSTPNQIGSKISAIRRNIYQPNNALVQGMDLAFFTTNSWGDSTGNFQDISQERMRIDHAGNVGIGTASPVTKLDLNGNMVIRPSSAPWGEGLQFLMPSTSTWGGLRWSRGRGNYDGNWYAGYTALDGSDDLVFGANNGGTQIDNILRMSKTGNVGIGTAAPSRKLEIASDVAGLSIEAGTGSPNAAVFRFGDNTGWKLHFGRSREIGGGAVNTGTAGTLMTIQDNGNVGIGTTNPAYKLEVSGSVGGGEIYTGGWFRTNTSGTGLYSQQNGNHIYSISRNYWAMTGGGANEGGLRFFQGHDTNQRGFVYWDLGSFGLLNNLGQWAIRVGDGGTALTSYGSLSIYGSKNGWGGISFPGNGTLMMNPNYSGFYNNTDNDWRWYVDNSGKMYGPGGSNVKVATGITFPDGTTQVTAAPTGIKGYNIRTNSQYLGGGHYVVDVYCPAGQKVIGGGFNVETTVATSVTASNPINTNGLYGWHTESFVNGSLTRVAYAICVD